ncbi:hypothetical protein [Draconibacterium mangrovi]|uniref:hypothetical protein n=1 Tax=Draconibacterium mangrovi TaxID=2697469 RepID=UPI0013CFB341|nr:hypothetical protein [Draconibacterium mangrovi]
MKILNDGIYFKQNDLKEVGYYTTDDDGDLIHHEYKKPTLWQRKMYYVRHGCEMNLNTKSTSYFYFRPEQNKVHSQLVTGDAVSTAKSLKKNGVVGQSSIYSTHENTVNFEKNGILYYLTFSEDGLSVKVEASSKADNKHFKTETYSYLDWYNI